MVVGRRQGEGQFDDARQWYGFVYLVLKKAFRC